MGPGAAAPPGPIRFSGRQTISDVPVWVTRAVLPALPDDAPLFVCEVEASPPVLPRRAGPLAFAGAP